MDVSIIIPIYNAEKTLVRTLEALKIQSFDKFEVLLINNGSTDSSEKICFDYLERDERFRYIYTDKKGVSNARNIGLEAATGEYICFCDADDIPDKRMLEVMMMDIVQRQVDCVMCNYYSERDKRISEFPAKLPRTIEGRKLTKDFVPLMFSTDGGQDVIWGTVWRMVFRKDIIVKNGLMFDTQLNFAEDLCFVLDYLKYSRILYLEQQNLYHYSFTKDSAMLSHSKYKAGMFEERKYLIYCLRARLQEMEVYDKNKLDINNIFQEYILDCVGNATIKDTDNHLRNAYKNLVRIMKDQLTIELFKEFCTSETKRKVVYSLIKRKMCLVLLLYYRNRRKGIKGD